MNTCLQSAIASLEPELLQMGDGGEGVRALQQALQALSIYNQTIDGYFGLETQQAVRQLQLLLDLEVTEVFDTATWYGLSFWSDAIPSQGTTTRPQSTPSRRFNLGFFGHLRRAS
ncbi:MAG: peptidoglycan-binding domain-containing protein [Cyanobacteria bacterium]|nr:peptidoglycan-binding domain-containing protein [Cyanobacteriota bacterium]MDA0865979.1 peptidoglycan-binding domain-containing protein [Cyanobacteriota bacterium]